MIDKKTRIIITIIQLLYLLEKTNSQKFSLAFMSDFRRYNTMDFQFSEENKLNPAILRTYSKYHYDKGLDKMTKEKFIEIFKNSIGERFIKNKNTELTEYMNTIKTIEEQNFTIKTLTLDDKINREQLKNYTSKLIESLENYKKTIMVRIGKKSFRIPTCWMMRKIYTIKGMIDYIIKELHSQGRLSNNDSLGRQDIVNICENAMKKGIVAYLDLMELIEYFYKTIKEEISIYVW